MKPNPIVLKFANLCSILGEINKVNASVLNFAPERGANDVRTSSIYVFRILAIRSVARRKEGGGGA